MDKRKYGSLAEDYAVKLLVRNGYKIINRNFQAPFAEIDIIAVKDDTLVFVEVKARRSLRFGRPEEAVNKQKINKIIKAGELFCKKYQDLPEKQRVDVVSLVLEDKKILYEKIIKVY